MARLPESVCVYYALGSSYLDRFCRETPVRTLAWVMGADAPHEEFQRLSEPLQLLVLESATPYQAATILQARLPPFTFSQPSFLSVRTTHS